MVSRRDTSEVSWNFLSVGLLGFLPGCAESGRFSSTGFQAFYRVAIFLRRCLKLDSLIIRLLVSLFARSLIVAFYARSPRTVLVGCWRFESVTDSPIIGVLIRKLTNKFISPVNKLRFNYGNRVRGSLIAISLYRERRSLL